MKQNTLEEFYGLIPICQHGKDCSHCCWLWKGQLDRDGYPKASYQGKKINPFKLIFTTRNNIKILYHLCHTCDNSSCANWNHGYQGTHAHNMKDKVVRKRAKTQLNESQVRQMRRLYHSGSWIIADLTALFPAQKSVVNRVLQYQDWSHLQGEVRILT